MSYFREDETRSLIENFVRWNGDGAAVRCALSIVGRIRRELLREAGPVIPAVGIDAGRVAEALARMDDREGRALVLYHGTPFTTSTKASAMRLRKRAFLYLVERAHPAFWEAYGEAVEALKGAAARFAESGRSSL